MNEEIPKFLFALREDIKDDKRFLPTKVEELSVGFDVRACQIDKKDITLRAGQYIKIPLGFRCIPESGWYYQLHPRSSLFIKGNAHSLIGIVDESFPLETAMILMYLPDISSLATDLTIKFGDRIGQLIPMKRKDMSVETISNEEYDELCKKRGATRTGGFGSSGTQ